MVGAALLIGVPYWPSFLFSSFVVENSLTTKEENKKLKPKKIHSKEGELTRFCYYCLTLPVGSV